MNPSPDRRAALSWAWRLPLLVLCGFYAAVPLAAGLTAATTPWWVSAGLAALCVLAGVAPAAAPAVLLGLVPLLPILPRLVDGVPVAIVHLVVLSQAVPVLVRFALRRTSSPAAPLMVYGWGLFMLVAVVSLAVELTPDRLRGSAVDEVWRDIVSQVPSYVFAPRTLTEVSALPLLLVLADGLLCALVVHATTTRATRRRVLEVGAVAAVVTALFGFVQARTGIGLQEAWQVFDPGIVRINSTFEDPNALAAYYALLGPVVAGLALGSAGGLRWAWGAGFMAIAVAMIMTAGRTGLLSLGLALCGLVWLGFARQLEQHDPWRVVREQSRRVARVAVLGIVLTVALLTLVGTALNVGHAQQTSHLHTWLYTLNLRQPVDAVAKGRLAVWRANAAMVRDAPVTGMGLGMGANEFERYREALAIESLPPDARLSAHNTFLLVTSELGLLGLTAWLLMLAIVVYGIRATGNLPAGDLRTWPALGLVAGLGGLVLTMMTGDRIVLAEDVVIGTTCAALATVGASRLPRRWHTLMIVVALLVVCSWPLRVATRGAVDAAALPSPRGLHGPQVGEGGEIYRWSTGYAVIFLPQDVRSVVLPVINATPNTQVLRVYLDGRLAEQRELPHGPRVELTYEVPQSARSRRWRRLTLEVSPTWQPPRDPRSLGVLVGEWRVERHAAADSRDD